MKGVVARDEEAGMTHCLFLLIVLRHRHDAVS